MATKALTIDSRENVSKPGKQYRGDAVDKAPRRTLQTLQYTSVGENRLIGKGTMKDENAKIKKKIKPTNERVKIFEDENTPTESSQLEERSTQTSDLEEKCDGDDLAEADKEALELMGGDLVPENYWKLLAEERRQALNDTLEENEQLHKELDSLKEENEKLTHIASKAEYLSSILQSVVSSDEEDSLDDDDDYKTGDEQLCEDDDKNIQEVCDSDSDSSVYCAAAADLVACSSKDVNTSDSDHESDCGDSDKSGETVLRRNAKKSTKNMSQRFSGDWVNVELNDEKVASTEIIQAEVLAVLKEDVSS